MDLEDAIEGLDDSSMRDPLVARHLSQMKTLRNDKKRDADLGFGLLRLVQAHESLVYVFYEKLLGASASSFHGYRLLGEALLAYGVQRMQGKVLTLGPDHVLGDLVGSEMMVLGAGGINVFFDALVYTPMPFLFAPDPILADAAEVIEGIFSGNASSNSVCEGRAGPVSFVLLEPLTLQNIGLGPLCRDVIEDDGVCSLFCGFAYRRVLGDKALV